MQNNDEADMLQQQIDTENAALETKRQALVQQRLGIIQDAASGGWATYNQQNKTGDAVNAVDKLMPGANGQPGAPTGMM